MSQTMDPLARARFWAALLELPCCTATNPGGHLVVRTLRGITAFLERCTDEERPEVEIVAIAYPANWRYRPGQHLTEKCV